MLGWFMASSRRKTPDVSCRTRCLERSCWGSVKQTSWMLTKRIRHSSSMVTATLHSPSTSRIHTMVSRLSITRRSFSVLVSLPSSRNGYFLSHITMTELIFVDPRVKVNCQYYRDVLLSQQMLPAIKHVDKTALWHIAPVTPSSSYCSRKHRTSLVSASGHQTVQIWTPSATKSGESCSSVYINVLVSNVDKLKQRLVEVSDDLQQTVIDSAVSQWRQRLRACVHAQGRHF